MKKFTKLSTILILFFLCPFIGKVSALTIPVELKIAISLSSGNWSNPAIWSDGRVPGDSSFVIIKSGHQVNLTANSSCESLDIEPNATLDNGIYQLRIQFMGWAHGINDVGYDNGVSSFGYAPIDSTWDINNPNNACWNIYKVDGTHAGTGNILISFFNNTTFWDRDDLGGTITGSGTISNTGSLYYYWLMMNTNGLKFNSACNITFHCNVFLQDFIGGTGYNILTENFGQIHLTGNASFIAGNMGNIFYNYPNASILVENGFLNLGDISGYNVCWFWNQGTITLLNGNINIPYGSLLDNYGKVIINGSLLGFDSSILECGFINDAPNSVLSVTKDIFPPSNKGTLTCTGMNGLGLPIEPNYIIYNGTTNQTILLPTQPFDPSSPLPYSVLVVDNIAGVTLNSDITVTDTLSLINGLVHLGNYNLTIGDTAAITGLPSAGNMIVATGTGELRKSFTSTGSFTFPVGDNDGTAEYSPVTLNFTAGTFTGAYAGVNLLNTAYPGVTGNYLNRYWNLSQSGITDFICNPTFQYTVNDVAGTEDNLSCTKVSPLPWITYGLTNTATHVLSATGVTSFSSFTGLKSSTPTTINELENITIGNGVTNCYDATDELRVAGNGTTFEVQAGGSVTLIAGMKISLLPGVQVLAGGYLLGTITTNGQYCGGATPASMVAAGTDGPPAIAETMNFRLYPNPTTGSFTLEQAGESQGQNLKVEIYSMLGERIMTESIIGEKKHQFMLGNVPTGIYLVRIFAGEKVETVKLIKQ